MVENSPARFKAWRHTTADNERIKSSTHATINLKYLQERSNIPHVVEGNVGKLATPLSSNTATATKGQKFVVEVFPAFKASKRSRDYGCHLVQQSLRQKTKSEMKRKLIIMTLT